MNSSDEFDLIELLQTIWDGKWKIAFFAVASLIGMVSFQYVQPAANFTASTKIKGITSLQADAYAQSNALGFFNVTPAKLFDLYIEQIEERSLLEGAIIEFGLLDVADYQSEEEFSEAVAALASTVKIVSQDNKDEADKNLLRPNGSLSFEFNNADKWKSALISVDEQANEAVRLLLQERFSLLLSVATRNREFQLEDINTQIENALKDYDKKTAQRLAFLREQAAIARELGVANNTIEIQTFDAQNSMVTNIKTDTPFYLRGYKAIEKEIELIGARIDKKAFVSGLFELEKKKRELEQDRTIVRAEGLFLSTPIISGTNFAAAKLNIGATVFVSQSRLSLMYVLASILGCFIGTVFVLVQDAVGKRKYSPERDDPRDDEAEELMRLGQLVKQSHDYVLSKKLKTA